MHKTIDQKALADWHDRLQSSRFLTNLHQRDADFMSTALQDPLQTLNDLCQIDPSWVTMKSTDLRGILRQRKRHLVQLLAALDYGKIQDPVPDLLSLTGYLSDFAVMSIEVGLRCLMAEQGFADHRGIVVLGMGKLGGCELNYSSDVDLIVLFDPSRLSRVADDSDNHRLVQRVVRHLVLFLEAPEAEGYIFRSDLRLRPDPSSMPLAVAVEAAIQYYESMGLAWERAAMLKARAIAGDLCLAEAFFNRIRPFIWRRNLDYASIEDINAIRARALKVQDGDNVDGINIKLIEGGIREIELYAQSLQLIWGGRVPSLQVKPTRDALLALAEAGIITEDIPRQLMEAYGYFRRLEHAAQLLNDQQCHSLPESEGHWQDFAGLMASGPAEIRAETKCYLDIVRDICQPKSVIKEETLTQQKQVDDPEWLRAIGYRQTDAVLHIMERWMGGGYRVTANERARRLLGQLMPSLIKAVASTTTPDDALARMDNFFEALPAGVQLFSLFTASPDLLYHCADIMGNAPRMANWLARKPRLFEYLLQTSKDPLPTLPVGVSGLEETLDECRRLAHEIEFRTSVGFMSGKIALPELFEQQSCAAELIVHQTLRALRQESAKLPKSGFAVIALGKLGVRQLMPVSDLDVMFLSLPEPDQGKVPYVRLAQRLLNGLTVPTAEGRLYEVDLRLRPHGDSGVLCTTFEAAQQYYDNEAWLWEYLALSQARILYADADIADRLQDWLLALQTKQHDQSALRLAIQQMRKKISQAFPPRGLWDLKHSHGGIMDAAFIRQYIQLCLTPNNAALVGGTVEQLLQAGADSGLLDQQSAQKIISITEWLTTLQAGLRVSGGDGLFSRTSASPGQQKFLTRLTETDDLLALEQHLSESYQQVGQIYAQIFDQ